MTTDSRTGPGGTGKSTIDIGLLQINSGYAGQSYLPYSIGLLQSYAIKNSSAPERLHFRLPVFQRKPVHRIVDEIAGADVLGFSIYVWNVNLSMEVARRAKERHPDTLIVIGGPQVPDAPEEFLRENPWVDVAVHNEGEKVFLALLEAYDSRDWKAIPSLSWIDRDGVYQRTKAAPRMRDLDEVPSPFLEGVFDGIIEANPDIEWIGLWETNRGCPFQCTFCDWGSATASKVNRFGVDRLTAEIQWMAEQKIEFVFCCDANFGIFERDIDVAEALAQSKKETGYPVRVSVQNTKNATERAYKTQKILSDAGLSNGVALSMQSMDPNTLVSIKRKNISVDTYIDLQKRFTRDGVGTYTDFIIGLPGETYDSFVSGVDRVIENGQHNRIIFNNLSILPNAEMGSLEYRRQHGIDTIETEIINIHGHRAEMEDDVPEKQDLVVATRTMPLADWRRTRSFAWMTALLHFDKLLQLPIILAHEVTGIGYGQLITRFCNASGERYPTLAGIHDFFDGFAYDIQRGAPEYVFSKEWLGIYWPADEYVFIKLHVENRFDTFYAECQALLAEIIAETTSGDMSEMLSEAIAVNKAMLRLPDQTDDIVIETRYNIIEFYRGVLDGNAPALRQGQWSYAIERSRDSWADLDDWCRRLVWYGNKKGAYLHLGVEAQKVPVGIH
ncbi:MAG: cobalamin-dependent protein [Alphaproteobacteria bacterium]|nr:cobalamin-dependent protein [Alphaproteobacteria bacterium]